MAFCSRLPSPCKYQLCLDSQRKACRRARSRSAHTRPAASQGQPTPNTPSAQPVRSNTDQGHNSQAQDEEAFEGLLPEEDWTVRGGTTDSLSSNTELGQAVQNACDELETLGGLEQESLMKANELLRKLGYKGNINSPDK